MIASAAQHDPLCAEKPWPVCDEPFDSGVGPTHPGAAYCIHCGHHRDEHGGEA